MAKTAKKQQKSARIDIVDFWRFFAAIMIVVSHAHAMGGGYNRLDYFVEFFFILTGFFIFRHFQKPNYTNQSLDAKAKNSLSYTWQRFLKLLPYVIPIVVISSLIIFTAEYIQTHWAGHFMNSVRNIVNEMLLLPTGIMPRTRVIGPIWYLSVMIFAMPIVALVAQSKRLNLFIVMMLPIMWLYFLKPSIYTDYGVNDYLSFFRGLFSMLAGGVVYFVVKILKTKEYKRTIQYAITFLEPALYLYAAIIGFFWIKPAELSVLVLFFAAIITLSEKSFSAKIQHRSLTFLGAISLPLFMWHYAIIRIIHALPIEINLPIAAKILLLIIVSTIISAIHYAIVQKITIAQATKRAKLKAWA